ncbi:MAG: hypothetical protein ACYDH5_07100 [Acidimicrobiales bacterium]
MSKRKVKRATGPAPVGCGARVVTDGALPELIEAYGDAYQAAVREVYLRCILRGEPWFAKQGPGRATSGVRAELIGRGWSQREATSIHTSAASAQESAIESAKLALERAEDDLEVVGDKLTEAKEALPKAETTKRTADLERRVSGLGRRRDILSARVARHRRAVETDDVRVCFGGHKLAVAGNDPTSHGYEGSDEWRCQWDRARGGGFLLHGDSESISGNYSARTHLAQDSRLAQDSDDFDYVMLRVPRFLRDLQSGNQWVMVRVKGFANNRADLAAAMTPDPTSHAVALLAWERSKELRDLLSPLRDAGVPVPVPKTAKYAPNLKTSRRCSPRSLSVTRRAARCRAGRAQRSLPPWACRSGCVGAGRSRCSGSWSQPPRQRTCWGSSPSRWSRRLSPCGQQRWAMWGRRGCRHR